MNVTKLNTLKGSRLLMTDRYRISRNEWTLLEIAPNGKIAKFRNELVNDGIFWIDIDDLILLDVLPSSHPSLE